MEYKLGKHYNRLPYYNDLEISELPADFRRVLIHCIFKDYVQQMLEQYTKIPEPSKVILEIPDFFDNWLLEVQSQPDTSQSGEMPAFGSLKASEEEWWGDWFDLVEYDLERRFTSSKHEK